MMMDEKHQFFKLWCLKQCIKKKEYAIYKRQSYNRIMALRIEANNLKHSWLCGQRRRYWRQRTRFPIEVSKHRIGTLMKQNGVVSRPHGNMESIHQK